MIFGNRFLAFSGVLDCKDLLFRLVALATRADRRVASISALSAFLDDVLRPFLAEAFQQSLAVLHAALVIQLDAGEVGVFDSFGDASLRESGILGDLLQGFFLRRIGLFLFDSSLVIVKVLLQLRVIAAVLRGFLELIQLRLYLVVAVSLGFEAVALVLQRINSLGVGFDDLLDFVCLDAQSRQELSCKCDKSFLL